MPESTITCNEKAYYSNLRNLSLNTKKDEYATLSKDYTKVDGSMFFLSRTNNTLNTGFVSWRVSNARGEFSVNPIVKIKLEAIRAYYGLKMEFGTALPAEFIIRTYRGEESINTYRIGQDEINQTSVILRSFDDFDLMEIEFTKTAIPYNRIILNHFSLSDVVNFTMERRDMMSSPKAIKQELIKEVVVPYYTYQTNDKEENLVYTDIDVTAGEVQTYYLQDASYGYTVKLDESPTGTNILASGNYYITIRFNETGNYRLSIQGHRYKIIERQVKVALNSKGKTIKWENPLINNSAMANDLAKWLSEYYTAGIEYEYDTRGNPELDATDIIYQENEFRTGMRVNVYRHTLRFNQAFSGRVTARRVGG